MKFMYMDESGKNIITQPNQSVFIFGGLVIDKGNVYEALNIFKKVYQHHRLALKRQLNRQVTGSDKSDRIKNMLDRFEIHATEMFSQKDKKRGTKLIKENPWRYYPNSEIFKMINELLIQLNPYIDRIYMFKIDKVAIINHYDSKNMHITDNDVYDDMIDCILDEYNSWLEGCGTQGALIPDRLDSQVRDKFVLNMNKYQSQLLWAEPITVDSVLNAFTQIIDLITYIYYLLYTNQTHKNNFNAIKKAYNKHIKHLIVEVDIVQDYLQNQKTNKCGKI